MLLADPPSTPFLPLPPAGSQLSDKEVSAATLADEARSVGVALGGMARDVAGYVAGQGSRQEESGAGGWWRLGPSAWLAWKHSTL